MWEQALQKYTVWKSNVFLGIKDGKNILVIMDL